MFEVDVLFISAISRKLLHPKNGLLIENTITSHPHSWALKAKETVENRNRSRFLFDLDFNIPKGFVRYDTI